MSTKLIHSAPVATLPQSANQFENLPNASPGVDLSIVIPCLNEGETLAACILQAQNAIDRSGVVGEIVVADNGSSDGSGVIAQRCGAKLVNVQSKGYGNALMGGIEAARGHMILMGDADRSYDFGEATKFIEKIRHGYDLVVGNRFRGGIRPGAMPWLHRVIGNPMLTRILNLFFHSAVGDAHCGMRAFTRDAYQRMNLQASGMEFASEMLVKARLANLAICEVPISYSRDGRTRAPHLRSFRDGWRHLRFLLIYSPRWLFAIPGLILVLLGFLVNAILFAGPLHVGHLTFDVHMMLLGSLLALVGFQTLCLGAFAKVFAVGESTLPGDPLLDKASAYFTLERGIIAGVLALLAGVALLSWLFMSWVHVSFGPLELDRTIRVAIPGMLLVTLGVQTVFSSFLLSILGFGTTSPCSLRRIATREGCVD